MESQAISRDSLRSMIPDAMKGKVVGPSPDGKAILVEVAGQTLQAQGDPETSAGTPVVLRQDPDGNWKASPLNKGVPEDLRQELWQALSRFLDADPPGSTTAQGKELRQAIEQFRQALGGRSEGILSAAQETGRILRQQDLPDASPEILLDARTRPLLLKARSQDGQPLPSGTNFLEITGTLGKSQELYSARLGGRAAQVQGPAGLAGNLGLWESWPSNEAHWLTPTRPQSAPSIPELPATVELSEAGLTGFLQRLLPESHTGNSPALTRETRALASLLQEVLSEAPQPDPAAGNQTTAARREVDSRTLLRLLDAWSQEGPGLDIFPETDKARLTRLLAGPVARSTPVEESVPRLMLLARENGQALPALADWARQNLSKLTHPHFPLGSGEEDPLRDLSLSLAKDFSNLPPDSPLRPQLKELAQEFLGSDLRSRQDPQGSVQVPWLQPQPQGMHEGNLRVLDRRRKPDGDSPQRTRVAITMQPPSLGKVDASLELTGRTLRVELASAEASTGQLIRQHLPTLAASLKALGLEPSVEVTKVEPTLSARPLVPAARPRLDLQA
ncbi:MAG: Flagellar hook-length control protein FliK [Fibrobacterota bacterium]|jgi:hypothetical protein